MSEEFPLQTRRRNSAEYLRRNAGFNSLDTHDSVKYLTRKSLKYSNCKGDHV